MTAAGGRRPAPEGVLAHAGVGDQDPTCPNGSVECARPGTPPCSACFFGDGGSP